MRIAVVDGQGGGIGKTLVERLRLTFGEHLRILALGTNAMATSVMLKAGANEGASGENAILCNVSKVDLILGSIGILAADSMLGELTEGMAAAIARSPATKILIPLNRCNLHVAGTRNDPLPHSIDEAMKLVCSYREDHENV
ncbi:MAG TPA: hypothetical protein DD727_07500 [Clostridiales bacterium]|nr:hypothetical protein [Clostridiales bacterium]